MEKRYIVTLTDDERKQLLELIKTGKTSARKLNRAHILLLSDEGKIDKEICEALHLSSKMVELTRKKFIECGVDYALSEVSRPGKARKLDGKQEAFLVAITCSKPPEGRIEWTMQLLADKMIELKIVDSICDETVRRTLKKHYLSRGKKSNGVYQK
jgi:transposase